MARPRGGVTRNARRGWMGRIGRCAQGHIRWPSLKLGRHGRWVAVDAGLPLMQCRHGCWAAVDGGPPWMQGRRGGWAAVDGGLLWMLGHRGCRAAMDAGPSWMVGHRGCWATVDAGRPRTVGCTGPICVPDARGVRGFHATDTRLRRMPGGCGRLDGRVRGMHGTSGGLRRSRSRRRCRAAPEAGPPGHRAALTSAEVPPHGAALLNRVG